MFNEKIEKIKMSVSEEDTGIILLKDEQEVCLLDSENEEEYKAILLAMENTEAKQEERVKPVQSRSNLRSRESLKHPVRYESNVATLSTPLTFKEAMKSEEASQWR